MRIATNNLAKDHNVDHAITVALMSWRLAPTQEAHDILGELARASSDLAPHSRATHGGYRRAGVHPGQLEARDHGPRGLDPDVED